MKKVKRPQDTTLRNARAAKMRIDTLTKRVRKLELQYAGLAAKVEKGSL
jgi:predicted metalloprotease